MKKIIFSTLLLLTASLCTQAQTIMKVVKTDSTIVKFPIEEIQKISFKTDSFYNSEVTIDNKYIDCSNGLEVQNRSCKCTGFVKINPNAKFKIPSFKVDVTSKIGLAFYDSNKEYVHGIPYPYIISEDYDGMTGRYVAPDNAMYVRYSLKNDQNPYLYDESNYPVAPAFRIYKAAASVLNYKGQFRVILNFGNGIMLGTSGNFKKGYRGGDNPQPAVNDDIIIYRSSDWGYTWAYMGNATNDLGLEEGLYYGDHDGNGTAIIGSGDYSRHYLLKVTNYGEDWENDYSVCITKNDIDALVGVSTNGCENVIYCGNNTFRALCNCLNGFHGRNAVIESQDNGDTWRIVNSENPLSTSVRSLLKTNEGVIWAVGMKADTGVWKSVDNGLNWERKSEFLAFMSIIEFNGNLYCGSMGNNHEEGDGFKEAYVYMSKDDGETWEKVLTVDEGWDNTYLRTFIPYGNMLVAVFCHGEAVSSRDTVFYLTSDNGKNWSKIIDEREGCYDSGFVEFRMQLGKTLLLNCNSGLFKLN
jgi:photosystem II stability/assembly factor-like uncharacterized protein